MISASHHQGLNGRQPSPVLDYSHAQLVTFSMGGAQPVSDASSLSRDRNYKERTLKAAEILAGTASGVQVVVVDGERLQLQGDYIGASAGALCRLRKVRPGTALVAVPLEAGDSTVLVNQVLPALPTRKERDPSAVAAVTLGPCRAFQSPMEFAQQISDYYHGLMAKRGGVLGGSMIGLLAWSSDIPQAVGSLGMLAAVVGYLRHQRNNAKFPSLLLTIAIGYAAKTAMEATVGFAAEAILPGISLQIPRAWSAPFLVGGLLLGVWSAVYGA